MRQAISANRLELLSIAHAVAAEKQIDREIVIEAMEESIQKAARSRYGAEYDIRVRIDRKTGEAHLERVHEVVEEVENHFTQLTMEDAKTRYGFDGELGGFVRQELPPMEFGRIAAQTAKQVILQKVREAERARQFDEFKDRIGTIINGVVKRVEYGNVVVDVGRGEAMLRRDQLIPRENFRVNDRIRCYIKDVRSEMRGPQIFLSRTAPEFMAKLFEQEVPEIYDGIIEIKAVARDPGSRAKIGVISYDNGIDPVGACVGMRGSRVQAVVGELQGEKIDIIPWSEDAATFIVNALQPAEVAKVVLDEDAQRIEVVVPDDQLSLAIGRRGQNVRLASQLTGWDIDIMTEAEESERRQAEFQQRTDVFMEALNVDEMVAQLLVSEGFTTLEEVAYVEIDELTVIDGFDGDTAEELQARARESLEEQNQRLLEAARAAGTDEALIAFNGLSPLMIQALVAEDIKTLDDFATLADWELAGGYTETPEGKRVKDDGILEPFDVSIEEARSLIMSARVALGLVDPDALMALVEESEAEAETEEDGEAGAGEETGVEGEAGEDAPSADSVEIEAEAALEADPDADAASRA
ncbi:MAG: transcription termination factor NusA [Rhodobacteraceae bacterium]|nr:transcription termination factor NusA [Paracoccaceae bacterium]